jgi:drug/metabolite transporter superfamily protein YnfA
MSDDGSLRSGAPTSPTLTVKEAYDIYAQQTESAHKLWTYFSVVSVAVLGYTVGNKDNNWTGPLFLAIGASYLGFALSNLWVLRQTQRECVECAGVLKAVAESSVETVKRLGAVKSVPVRKVTCFHVFAQAVVVAAMYLTWTSRVESKVDATVAIPCPACCCASTRTSGLPAPVASGAYGQAASGVRP